MPVKLLLDLLVSIHDSRHAWPEQFDGLIAKLEDDPSESTVWLVLADWLKEQDEPGLEDACRWFVKHTEVTVECNGHGQWIFVGLPVSVSIDADPPGDRTTLAGAIAMLAARLRRVREAVAVN